MRRLLGVLRQDEPPAPLATRQSLQQLGDLLEQYRRAGLEVELTVDGDERTLPQGLDLAAYRVVQEALTNTLKHAPGSSAAVHVTYRPHAIELCVTDTGSVRAPEVRAARADGPGHGIVGMRERAEIYGGRLDAGPDPDGGFRVTASFPLEAVAV
jgi:signal transduction histidine kinase